MADTKQTFIKKATFGQLKTIREKFSNSASFELLKALESLTDIEASMVINYGYRYRPGPKRFRLRQDTPIVLTAAQLGLIWHLFMQLGFSTEARRAQLASCGARFVDTLTISQADKCIKQLNEQVRVRMPAVAAA